MTDQDMLGKTMPFPAVALRSEHIIKQGEVLPNSWSNPNFLPCRQICRSITRRDQHVLSGWPYLLGYGGKARRAQSSTI